MTANDTPVPRAEATSQFPDGFRDRDWGGRVSFATAS